MYCSILTNIHPMIGVDIHPGTLGPPDPPKPMPHFVAQLLGGLNTKAKLVPSVMSHNFIVLNQGTDIGMGIGHVAPNIFFPLYVLTSSSSSNFGSYTVLSANNPTAAAVGVYVNINLNCGGPLSTTTGMVVAPGCNMVGITLADFVAGLFSNLVGVAISFVSGSIAGGLSKVGSKVGTNLVGNIVGKFSATRGLQYSLIMALSGVDDVTEEIVSTAIGEFLSSPGSVVGDFVGDQINKAMIPNYTGGERLN